MVTLEVIAAATEEIIKRGIPATFEYPGFIHIELPGMGKAMNWGDVNGEWDYDLVNAPEDDGTVHDHGDCTATVPGVCDPIAIADHIVCSYNELMEVLSDAR